METGGRWRRVAVDAATAVLVAVVGTVVAVWRLGPVARGTVWAEDGGVFLRERVALGPVQSLLEPYAGYLHLVPRLLVDLAWAAPVERYALVLSVGSCAVLGASGALVVLLGRDAVPWLPGRLLLGLLPATLPVGPVETTGNVANLHWYLLALAPWVFAHRARTWAGAVGTAVVAVGVVLSEPQAVVFLPLLVLAWWGRTSAARLRALPVTVVALTGCAWQLGTAATTERTADPGSPALADVVAGWLWHPVASTWNPDVGAVGRVVVVDGWAVLVVPAALVVALLVAGAVAGPWRTRWMIAALAAGSFGVWWAALLANAGVGRHWATPTPALTAEGPLRYAAAAGLLLLGSAVVAGSALVVSAGGRGRSRRTVSGLLGWALVSAVVVTVVGNAPPSTTRRDGGPVWAAQVPAARAACAGDRDRVVAIRTVPWQADVPCARLLGR